MHAYRLIWPVVAMLICGSLAFNSGCGSGEPDDLGDWGIAIEDLESVPPDVLFTAEAHDPDSHLSVRFTAEATDGTTLPADSVTWTFGDGGMNTGTTVFHTYVAEGDYVVQAQASYQQTATAKAKNFVVHVRRFKVQVSAQPSQGQVPLATQLNGQATLPTGHSAGTYLWDFGDGEMAEGSLEVTHTFVEPGQYPVELTVITNRGWQRTGRISVEGLLDNLPPQAVIQAGPLSGWAPVTVLFDGSQSSDPDGDPIISYDWEFGDGQTAEGEAVEHTYQVRGNYQARLTVTDARGASGTAEVTVAVDGPNQAPTACMEADPTSGTAPLQVTFRAQCSSDDDGSIQSYNWDFGDGVSTGGIEVTHTYQGPGDYTAALMVIDNEGGTDSVGVTIHVNDGPSASFVVTPEDSVAPTVVHFDASASGDSDGTIASYRWEFGDGQTLEGAGWEQAQHTYGSGGSYVIRLTVTDDEGASASAERSVWLAELVVQPASIDFGDSGSDETLQISNTGGAGLTYNISIDYGGGPGGWLAVDPVSGTCPAGQTSMVTVTDSRDLLEPGSQSAVINVTAGSVTKAVGVSIAVVAVATSVDSHDFGSASSWYQLEVWNSGAGTLEFEVAGKPAWLTVVGAPGTSAGPSDRKTLTLTVDRSGLAAGSYAGDMVIMPRSDQGEHGKTVGVTMSVAAEGVLSVTPGEGLSSSGTEGGPFSPTTKTCALANIGRSALDWTVAKTQPWVDLSKSSGSLAAGESDAVVVSINSQGESLSAGSYSDTVTFTNTTNGLGDTTRSISLTVRPSGSDCKTSSTTWQNFPIVAQNGTFRVEFDATPGEAGMDGVIAVSTGAGASYSDFAVLVRFNDAGRIDARDGGTYNASTIITHTPSESYHFRLVIDVPAHSYSIYVTPEGSNEQTLGAKFAFRTEQNTVTSLDNWGFIAEPGSLQVCNFTIGTAPLIANAGPDRAIAPAGSTTLAGSASGGSPPYSYSWSPTTGLSDPNAAQPTISLTETGVYSYTLTVTDAESRVASDTVTVTVAVLPMTVDAGPDKTIAPGGSTPLEGSASGGTGPYSYSWSPATGLSSPNEAQPTASPTGTTIYTVTVTDSQGGSASDSMTVNVIAGTIYCVAKNDPNASDFNPGTEALPWQTLAKAANTAQAGDTVLIKASVYYETLAPAHSGAPGAPITFMAYPAQECQDPPGYGYEDHAGEVHKDCQVVLDGQRAASLGVDLRSHFVSYIRIEGLEIRNFLVSAVYIRRGDDDANPAIGIELVNNFIHHNGGDLDQGDFSQIIKARDTQDSLIENNEIFWNSGTAIQIGGLVDFATDGIVIRGNNIHRNGKDGLRGGGRNILIEHNRIYDQFYTVHHPDALDLSGQIDNAVIRYNVIYDFTQLIYFPLKDNPNITVDNIAIYGNLLYNDRWYADGSIHGPGHGSPGVFFDARRATSTVRNVDIHSNTFGFLGSEAIIIADSGLGLGQGDVSAVTIRNNICYQSPVRMFVANPAEIDSDYNLFFEATGFNEGAHSVYSDPEFVGYRRHEAFDFHLLPTPTNPAINAGVDVSVSKDLDGNPRPVGGAYDIGAYEVQAP